MQIVPFILAGTFLRGIGCDFFMKKQVVLIGVGGYGDVYPSLYLRYPELYAQKMEVVGVVDPFAAAAPKAAWFAEKGIPVFDRAEDFYKTRQADLAVISSPIPQHKAQCLTAMENGSDVLCEKPLVPTVEEAAELIAVRNRCGRKLGVGFQWSFCRPMTRLKRDILAGRFGRPVLLKSLICWKRDTAYYSGGWKGKLRTREGALILDSVVTNATAHYLHNIFFVLGDRPDTAAMPIHVAAEVYRAKPIESFDTVVLRGSFENGARFWYGATHSNDERDVTTFLYQFEKGEVRFNTDRRDDHVYAVFSDGTTEDYGNPQAFEELNPKLLTMLAASGGGEAAVPCGVETVLPHLKVCNGLFMQAGIQDIDPALVFASAEPEGVFVHGLSMGLSAAYAAGRLPSELGLPFAGEAVTFSPAEINRFTGVRQWETPVGGRGV